MAAIKGFANQILGAKTTGGAADAQTFTSDSVAAIDTAYAAGMGFVFKAGFTNTGAATLNVDGVGAKSIKKGGAQSALVANDIVAGGIYAAYYEASGDCFILLNPETGQTAAGNQPLDATLTALAAISWSSGSPLLQWTAADTISLTLTPSVSSVTASQGAAATTPTGTFINTTDNASVEIARFEGDRATPTASDEGYLSLRLSNASGTQVAFGRITIAGTTLTAASEAGALYFETVTSGAMGKRAVLTATTFRPNANDQLTLGTATLSFADLFLASGGIINWNNGNATLTHSAGLLASSVPVQAALPISTETSGTLTSASRNKKVKMSGDCTINDGVFTADDWIIFENNSASTRQIIQDTGMTLRLHGSTTTGTRTVAVRGGAAVGFDTNAEAIVYGDVT